MNILDSVANAALNQLLSEITTAGGSLSVKIYTGSLPSTLSTPSGTLLIDFVMVSPILTLSNRSIQLPVTTETSIAAGTANVYTIQDQSGRNIWQDYIGSGIADPSILTGDLVQLNLTIKA